MKFIDLDFDCLENVLEYLELVDLLNVADSTKRLRKAAELVYGRKYGKHLVTFGVIKISPQQSIRSTNGIIRSECLKTNLQLLRCVGPLISEIFLHSVPIQEADQSQIDRFLFTYINGYCAEHLKKISLQQNADSHPRPVLDYFEKPFTNLIRFSHVYYNFTQQICLKTLFPKLHELWIDHRSNASFFKFNTQHFPNLEKILINENVRNSSILFRMVLPFLQVNPQLKELQLCSSSFRSSNLNINLIWSAVDSLQNIETLHLRIRPIDFMIKDDKIIRMEKVKIFVIGFNELEELPVCFLPFLFGKLEKFEICFPKEEFRSPFMDEFYDFIEKHSTITHLIISYIERSEVVDWSRLAKSLPSLLMIFAPNCLFSTEEALDLIAEFQQLKNFVFKLRNDFETFCKRLGYEWNGKIVAGIFVELNRI